MAMKKYSTLPSIPEQELHHQIQFCVNTQDKVVINVYSS